ncbi:MAG: hypothetical protein ACPGXX_19450, partial [Planctomycetaceae bacterium]
QRAYDEHLEEAKEFDAVITTLEKEQEWWRSQERGRRPLYPTRIRQTVEAELHAANNASRKHHDESGVLERQLREAEAEREQAGLAVGQITTLLQLARDLSD